MLTDHQVYVLAAAIFFGLLMHGFGREVTLKLDSVQWLDLLEQLRNLRGPKP